MFEALLALLQNTALGFFNLLLSPFKLGGWFFGIINADSRAAEAQIALDAMTEKLTASGDLAAFDAALVPAQPITSEPDLVEVAEAAIESGAFSGNAADLAEYARLKSLAVEFPADPYIVDFLLFGKSAEFFFMVFALILGLLIAGLIYRPILRGVSNGINSFNGTIGKLASWLALLMAFQQIMIIFLQQVFRANGFPISFFGLQIVPGDDVLTMPWFATELMFYNAAIIAFACAFTFLEEGHVRVDLIYGALSRRVRHWVDVVGTLIFLLPSMFGLWWVSWHLAMNKMFQITSFNPLTTEILTRNFDGRIPNTSAFKTLNWNTSTGENFSHVPLYYVLILVLAALMILQGVSFLFSSLDKGMTSDAQKEREDRDADAEAKVQAEQAADSTSSGQPVLGSA